MDEVGSLLWGKGTDELKDIASLSKMMTLYVAFRYISAGLIQWDQVWQVSSHAAETIGTSACLKAGD
jgi:D-alanyl-D-alanine carboxypeptidase